MDTLLLIVLEENIMKLEERKEELEQEMVDPENLSDHEYLTELKLEYEGVKEELEELYDKWEEII